MKQRLVALASTFSVLLVLSSFAFAGDYYLSVGQSTSIGGRSVTLFSVIDYETYYKAEVKVSGGNPPHNAYTYLSEGQSDTTNDVYVYVSSLWSDSAYLTLSFVGEAEEEETEEEVIEEPTCGNGFVDSGEVCDGQGKDCKYINSKYYWKTAPCKSDCSGYDESQCNYCGDGQVTDNERCDGGNFGGQSCQSQGYSGGSLSCSNCNYISTVSCYRCGDYKKNPGETCQNCPTDAKCPYGQVCGSNGECIQLGTDENCNYFGQSCICVNRRCVECRSNSDCASEIDFEHTGQYECTADNTGRYEILLQKGGECLNNQCTGSSRKNSEPQSCGDEPCQDGQCGCKEGYTAYKGECLKERSKNLNDPCKTDFQCKSDFCHEKKCKDALIPEIKTEKEVSEVGDEIDVSISLTNTLETDIQTQLILTAGSGVTITRSDGAKICTSSQCTNYDTVSGKGSKDIKLRVEGKDVGEVEIKGEIIYTYAGRSHSLPIAKTIIFTKCGDGTCDSEYGETQENCCNDCGTPRDTETRRYYCEDNELKDRLNEGVVVTFAGIIILILFIVGFIRFIVTRPPKPKPPKIETVECEDCGAIVEKGTKFCTKCGHALGKKKQHKEHAKESGPKFCIGCGEKLDRGSKFCTICGESIEE